MNNMCIVGNITRDIDLKFVNENFTVAEFSVAVKKRYKNKEGNYDSVFFNCKAFNKQAELIAEKFQKGDCIALEVSYDPDTYEKDRKNVTVPKFSVNGLTFLNRRKENADSMGGAGTPVDDGDMPFN